MRNYTLLIEDDRYADLARMHLLVASDCRAKEFARAELARSPHCRSVEVRHGGGVIASFRAEGSDGASQPG